MQMREKVGKSRNTVFFQWFEAPEGQKVGWLKRRVRREPFGQMRDEKLQAVVARSTCRSRNVQKTPAPDHLWTLRCRKSARRCGAKHISKSKCTKHTILGPLLEVQMSKKCTPLWREAHFEVNMLKSRGVRITFGGSDAVPCGRCKGLSILSKASKTWGFCSISKRWQASDFWRGSAKMRSTKDMFMRDVRRSGRSFPERGCILEHQSRFAKMILRDRCSTSYDLASIFRGRRSTLDRWSRKNPKRIGTRLSALHSTFHFWRKSRRIVLFLMSSSSKIEEVSQNCFVLDVVKFKKWRKSRRIVLFLISSSSKLKKSRRIASFWMLSSSKKWRSLAELFRFWQLDR